MLLFVCTKNLFYNMFRILFLTRMLPTVIFSNTHGGGLSLKIRHKTSNILYTIEVFCPLII
jgi:hypothetical protein